MSAQRRLTRRGFIRTAAVASGLATLSACGATATPQVIEKEVTRIVEGTPQVVTETVVVKETVVVEQTVAPSETAAAPVEIVFWQPPIWRYGKDNLTPDAPPEEWISDACDRFEQEYPSITVTLELIPWDQWGQKLTTAFASGTLPNVLYSSLSIDRVQAGVLEPVDDYVTPEELANWLPGRQAALTIFGRLYGFPAFLNPNHSALSKTALEKHGGAGILEAMGEDRGGLTFDMMKEYGTEFGDGASRFFLGVPTDHGSVSYWGFGCWLKGWGVPIWDEAQERWVVNDYPEAVDAFQWYLDAQNTWKIMIPNLPKWSDVDNFYWNLNCAMRMQWPGIQTELETAQSAGQAPEEFELYFAVHPHLEDVKPWTSGAGEASGHYVVGRTSDAAKRQAAATFGKWLGGSDSNAPGWLVNGFFPATVSGAAAVADHPKMADPNYRWCLETYLQKFEPETPGTGSMIHPSLNPRTASIMSSELPADYYIQQFQSLLLGQKTPKEMLSEMATLINTALGVEV